MSPLLSLSLDQLQKLIVEETPHNHFLGMRLVEFGEGRLVLDVPFQSRLVGDAQEGGIHEGVTTSLIDTACGSVILSLLAEFRRPATLDLRVDYRRASRPGRDIRCEATCDQLTEHLAIVRAIAHDGDPVDVVATAVASFALFKSSPASSAATPVGNAA